MYMILPTNSWAAFLESFSWNSDPTLSISSTCWWRRNGYLVAKEQNQWTQCWKKHNAWNCSQICWICTIIHAGSKWFSRLLPVEFIAPSSNQGACHSGWRAAGWTCWFGWGSGVMAADGLVGWCFRTNKSKRKKMDKTNHCQSAIPFSTEFITWSNTLRYVGAKNCIGAKDWSVQQRILAFELGKRNWLVKLS